jgi:hypothetical protein
MRLSLRDLFKWPAADRNPGFAMLSAVALLSLVLGFGVVIVQYVLTIRSAAKNFENQIYATQLAEAGMFKALHCLNATSGVKCGGTCGTTYVGETMVNVGVGYFSSSVTGTGSQRLITVTGYTRGGLSKTLKADVSTLPPYQAGEFDHAVQVDDGGARIENQADITGGTIYSDADINCGTNVTIESDVFVSKVGGKIDRCKVEGDAHADNILNATVNADGYYKDSKAGSTIKGTAYQVADTPPYKPMPPFDLAYWRARSERGGILYGDQSPADGTHLGPVKILGDLNLANGVDIILDGPVWVMGDIILSQNCSMSLATSFGAYSTVVLADDPADPAGSGRITVENNAVVNGSGHAASFVLLVSTNTSLADTSPAIDIGNNAGGGIFYATEGTVRVRNNASATAIAGTRAFVDQNGSIDYESGGRDLSDIRLSTLPPGTWRIMESAWREVSF